jgi:hypothetical protein
MGAKKKKEAKEKPLDKMTSKELRETALKIPEITGVHGMNKYELLSAIKKARGIEEKVTTKSDSAFRDLKKRLLKLKKYKEKNYEDLDTKQAKILRRRMNRLKKRTRRAA